MKKSKKSSVGLTIFSLIFGLGFIVLGVYLYFDFAGSTIDNAVETTGKVVSLFEAKSTSPRPRIVGSDENKAMLPIVEFTTTDGKRIEFQEKWAAEDEELQYIEGQDVVVIYNSKLPEDATIKKKESIGMVHFFLIGMGLFFLLLPKLRKIALE